MDQIDRQVFSRNLSDEACSDIDLSSGELAKSEVALQESLGEALGTVAESAISAESA
jgi:hypothetical protein